MQSTIHHMIHIERVVEARRKKMYANLRMFDVKNFSSFQWKNNDEVPLRTLHSFMEIICTTKRLFRDHSSSSFQLICLAGIRLTHTHTHTKGSMKLEKAQKIISNNNNNNNK